VEHVSQHIRKIPGFGGKGFRMKEIVLDLAEMTRAEQPAIEGELLDFGVVGPGPRRTLNFIKNRRWFDNEQDRSPAAEQMYVAELRDFRAYLQGNTSVDELKELNLLGVQLALCEAHYLAFGGRVFGGRQKTYRQQKQSVSHWYIATEGLYALKTCLFMFIY